MAFTTLEELFEPIVMFGLTKFPDIFQAMMNKLLRDLINIKKVGSFINDVMIRTESKKGHNKLIEEILMRMEENDLYMKLEKCK